jgi:hypothetical protein
MKNQTKNTEQKTVRQNNLRFIEYEKPSGDGHFITIADSYHNVIGRVHKSFNEETKKYEYVAFDHAGNLMSKSDKLWELKNEFVKNREHLLEQAHQRRVASKDKSNEMQTDRTDERKNEMENLRNDKNGIEKQYDKSQEKSNSNAHEENNIVDNEQSQQDEREQELDDIRSDRDDDRGDMDLDR